MNLITRFKSGLMLAAASAGMFVSVQVAQAAGTITIEQKSIMPILGEWSFYKLGNPLYPYSKEEVGTKTITESNRYVIQVKEPGGALTTISLYEEGEDTISVAGDRMTVDLDKDKDYRILISYRYDGMIAVESEPSGAPFVLVSPYDITYSGVTPATFKNLPPKYFKAQYLDIEGCITPKPQERATEREVQFFGRYNCAPVKPVKPEPNIPEETRGGVNLTLSAKQSEVFAGEDAVITLSVRNLSKRTQHDHTVSMEFDPSLMQIVKTLPGYGTVDGDMAIWIIPDLFAGRTWTVEFPVLVKENVPEGTTMALSARVSGPEVDIENSRNVTDTIRVGVAIMPATGGQFALLFLALSSLLALVAVRRMKLQ